MAESDHIINHQLSEFMSENWVPQSRDYESEKKITFISPNPNLRTGVTSKKKKKGGGGTYLNLIKGYLFKFEKQDVIVHVLNKFSLDSFSKTQTNFQCSLFNFF